MAAHQHNPARPQRACKRSTLLRFGHDQSGVAKIVARIPKRHGLTERGAEMENRLELHTGNAERQNRRRMVVTHRVHVWARLVDTTVDHPLAVESRVGLLQRLRVECKFENVIGLHKLWSTRS